MDERKLRPELYSHLSLEAASKEISKKWKCLEASAKHRYQQMSRSQKNGYNKAKRNLIVKQLKGVKVKQEKRRVHQPFVAFIREHYRAIKQGQQGLQHQAVMALLSQKWSRLTPQDKEVYRLMVSE